VHTNGTNGNSANESLSLQRATDIPALRGTPRFITVTYTNKTLQVTVAPNIGPSIHLPIDLITELGLKQNGGDGTAYIGNATLFSLLCKNTTTSPSLYLLSLLL